MVLGRYVKDTWGWAAEGAGARAQAHAQNRQPVPWLSCVHPLPALHTIPSAPKIAPAPLHPFSWWCPPVQQQAEDQAAAYHQHEADNGNDDPHPEGDFRGGALWDRPQGEAA